MASDKVMEYNLKIKNLKSKLLGESGFISLQSKISPFLVSSEDRMYYTVFVSICNTKTKAVVFRATGMLLSEAWNEATDKAHRYILDTDYSASWVKVDIINRSKIVPVSNLVNKMCSGYPEFYRHGVSFDKNYESALLETELNCNDLIDYREKRLNFQTISDYLIANLDTVLLHVPKEAIEFDTLSYFCDEKDNVYELYEDRLDNGRRVVDGTDPSYLLGVIKSGTNYLADQVKEDGSFIYGYYPLHNQIIPGYNIMRHCSSIWSMICSYELTHDYNVLDKAELAMSYLLGNIAYVNADAKKDRVAYLIEKNTKEAKLGANGVIVILLTEYMKRFNTDIFTNICIELGNGILRMLNYDSGEFTHVLNFPSFTVKEKYRTVYYDGEATFALARLYSLTKDEKWLEAAKASIEHFIAADYTKYRDHWISYALNEVTKYVFDERYYEFALRNVDENLKKIHNQETTYHTYLELLTSSFELVKRIKDEKIDVPYMDKFDEQYFYETILHRAQFMLNGYGYPEYVMYFDNPSKFAGSFFIRHDRFRTRIDDVQHFCSSYISYISIYNDLMQLIKR